MKNCRIGAFVALLSLFTWTQSAFAEDDGGCNDSDINNMVIAGGACVGMVASLVHICIIPIATAGVEVVTTSICGIAVAATALVCGVTIPVAVKAAYCLNISSDDIEKIPTKAPYTGNREFVDYQTGRLGYHVP